MKLLQHCDSIRVSRAHSPGKTQTLFFGIDVLVWEKNRDLGVRCPCSCLLTISITVLADIGLSECVLWKTRKFTKKTSKVSHVLSGWHIWVAHTPEVWTHLSIGGYNCISGTIHECYLPPSSWLLVRKKKKPTPLEIGSIRNRKDNESPKRPQGFGIDFLILPLTQNPIWWFSLGWI